MKLSISLAAGTTVGGVLIALFGIVGLSGTLSVQAAQRPGDDGKTYDFQRHYKTGEVDLYQADLVVTMKGAGGKEQIVKYTIISRETVKSSTPDGAMTFVLEYDKAAASFDGKTEDYTALMPRATMVRDSDGRTRNSIEAGKDAHAAVMVQLMTTARKVIRTGMPAKPVKIGETWKIDADDPNAPALGVAGLDSLENINGFKTLKVNFRTDIGDANAAAGSTHTGASVWVDVLTGKPIKMACRTDAVLNGDKTTVDIQFHHLDDPNAPIAAVRRLYRVGEIDHYQFDVVNTTNSLETGGKDRVVKYRLLLRETVQDIAQDGTVTLLKEAEKAGIAYNNTEVDITAMMPTMTEIRTAQGGFQIKVEGGDAQLLSLVAPMMAQVSRAQRDVLPPKPVKVGDGWTFTRSDTPDSKTTGSVTLETTQNFNGAKTLRWKTISDMAGADARRRDEAIVMVDAQTGRTLQMNSRSASVTGENKVTTDVTYSLVADKGQAGGREIQRP